MAKLVEFEVMGGGRLAVDADAVAAVTQIALGRAVYLRLKGDPLGEEKAVHGHYEDVLGKLQAARTPPPES